MLTPFQDPDIETEAGHYLNSSHIIGEDQGGTLETSPT